MLYPMPSDILCLLPDELPHTFLLMPYEEQRWRGRVFLMAWVIFGHEAYSWFAAFGNEPEYVSNLKAQLETIPDERIAEAFAVAWEERRRW
jgi:hypothetical protein